MKMGIGTAQFGLNYGVSNDFGITLEKEAFRILDYAAEIGVDTIDTAAAYGNSEAIIGKYLKQNPKYLFRVISKFKDAKSFVQDAENSRTLFNGFLYGYLAHSSQEVFTNTRLIGMLTKLRAEHNVKIGVSVYDQFEIEKLIEMDILDIVQVPLNILDHRLIKCGLLAELKKRAVEIHARSIFLQGLLFLSEDRIKKDFSSVESSIKMIRSVAAESKLSVSDLAIQFVNSIPEVDKLIIGVNSKKQLIENEKSLSIKYNKSITKMLLDEIDLGTDRILDPRLWNQIGY